MVYHILSVQNFQNKIRSFLHNLFSSFAYYMGNCIHCFMSCSQMLRHVSIFDASIGFNELHIHNHTCHIETEFGNLRLTNSFQ